MGQVQDRQGAGADANKPGDLIDEETFRRDIDVSGGSSERRRYDGVRAENTLGEKGRNVAHRHVGWKINERSKKPSARQAGEGCLALRW